MEYTKFVGLDTHKETVAVAVAKEGGGEPDFLGTIPNNPEAIARLIRRLGPVPRKGWDVGSDRSYRWFRKVKKEDFENPSRNTS